MSEIMKIIDEREREKKNKKEKRKKNKEKKKQRIGASYRESVRAKWLCCAFKLGFGQLICKASLIFKSKLELALSIILKERESYESNQVVVECRCKFHTFLNLSFKMTTIFANIAITTASTSEFMY